MFGFGILAFYFVFDCVSYGLVHDFGRDCWLDVGLDFGLQLYWRMKGNSDYINSQRGHNYFQQSVFPPVTPNGNYIEKSCIRPARPLETLSRAYPAPHFSE